MIRNPSTRVCASLLAIALWVGVCAPAQTLAADTPPLQLAPDAPDRYTVVRGDTLWGIAGRFLSAPWQWPQSWQRNREEIANPHLIYTGDGDGVDRTGRAIKNMGGWRGIKRGKIGGGAEGEKKKEKEMGREKREIGWRCMLGGYFYLVEQETSRYITVCFVGSVRG